MQDDVGEEERVFVALVDSKLGFATFGARFDRAQPDLFLAAKHGVAEDAVEQA